MKKEGKTCVTSVTILMFKKFRQTTPSLKQICLGRFDTQKVLSFSRKSRKSCVKKQPCLEAEPAVENAKNRFHVKNPNLQTFLTGLSLAPR